MGTSIHPAFKLRHPHQLWILVADIHQKAQANVVAKLKSLYWHELIWLEPDDLKEKTKADSWYARLEAVHEKLKKAYGKASLDPYRSEYNFDVSLGVTEFRGDCFLRPFCDHASAVGGSLDFLKDDSRLLDFHYQNKTDKPAYVSQKAWNRRERTWDAMLDESGFFANQLILDVCSYDIYLRRLDPWLSLYQEYSAKPPKLPCREAVFAQELRKRRVFKFVRGRPGLIEGRTIRGKTVTIEKGKTLWYSSIKGRRKRHASLKEAFDHVCYCHLPPYMRRMVDRLKK